MYAILQHGGHQYRVSPGDRLLVDRLSADVGATVTLEPVLVLQDDASAAVGAPAVSGARVSAVVVGHRLGRKIRVFKYKPKKRYRRTHGHRSRLTELRIESVLGSAVAEAAPKAASRGRARGAPAAAGPATAPDELSARAGAPRRARRPQAGQAEESARAAGAPPGSAGTEA